MTLTTTKGSGGGPVLRPLVNSMTTDILRTRTILLPGWGILPTPAQQVTYPNQLSQFYFLVLSLMALTVALFHGTTHNGFVNWDDEQNFLTNGGLVPPFFRSIKWAWTTRLLGVYEPIGWHLIWLQSHMWGLSPELFHWVSVLLYAMNVALLFVFIYRLMPCSTSINATRSAAIAACSVFWFACHPLRVEVVAWASSQKYLWAIFFGLLSAICYLKGQRQQRWYYASIVFFCLGLLCKVILFTFPFLLLALNHRKKLGETPGVASMKRFVLKDWPLFLLLPSVFCWAFGQGFHRGAMTVNQS